MSKLKYFDGTNWNIVNGQIVGDTLPIGAIVPFGGWDAPTGWLICDGTLLNKATYPELFNAIGYSFGGEEGGSTFGLPDLRGRVPVGEKDNDSDFDGMGVTGGSKYLQAHTHSITKYWGNPGTSYGYTDVFHYSDSKTSSATLQGSGDVSSGVQTGNSGNLQPYQTVNYIIKAKQSAGVVGNVSNTYSTSQSDTYSCATINGTDLWTNTNPYSSFAGQDINIDLSAYKKLEIYCVRYGPTGRNILSYKIYLDSVVALSQLHYSDYDSGVRSWNREVSWTSNKITFGDGLLNGSTSNSCLIPYKIIGYKY